MTQRFIEFVLMHSQNAALFLGQIPNPQTGKPEINLDLAKMFIDQLVAIRIKTHGNLSKEETGVLDNAISNLQLIFVEASRTGGKTAAPAEAKENQIDAPEASQSAETAPEKKVETPKSDDSENEESKKRFTKSYGA